MLISSGLVLLMIPAVSLIYSGVAIERVSTLSLFRLPVLTAALCWFQVRSVASTRCQAKVDLSQWYLFGYMLTFTKGNLWWGGELRAFGLRTTLNLEDFVIQLCTNRIAVARPALVCGGVMTKMSNRSFLIFIFFWSIFVYYPIARWTWYADGWGQHRGMSLDTRQASLEIN